MVVLLLVFVSHKTRRSSTSCKECRLQIVRFVSVCELLIFRYINDHIDLPVLQADSLSQFGMYLLSVALCVFHYDPPSLFQPFLTLGVRLTVCQVLIRCRWLLI